jgi:hypothetical protein
MISVVVASSHNSFCSYEDDSDRKGGVRAVLLAIMIAAALARDLQLTPGPREYLATSASQGPPAYSRAPEVPS